MREKFKRKAIKIGTSTGFTVPAFLIENKKIEKGKEYDVEVSNEEE